MLCITYPSRVVCNYRDLSDHVMLNPGQRDLQLSVLWELQLL